MFGKQKILIVDDDENIAELISLYLTKECFDTKLVYDGEDALAAFDSYQPNLILLDLMLPGIDGYQVCREIRSKAATPIIMLSAKSEVFDKVLGLELGADDYIMKPFDPKEMVARVRAVLRRYQVGQQNDTSVEKTKCAEFDGLTINLTNYSVVCDGHPVDMPPKELELLYCLAASPNQVFTREQLLDRIWGYEYIGDTRPGYCKQHLVADEYLGRNYESSSAFKIYCTLYYFRVFMCFHNSNINHRTDHRTSGKRYFADIIQRSNHDCG